MDDGLGRGPLGTLAMAVLVTLRVFSGRPGPTWRLTPSQEAEFDRRLTASPVMTPRSQPSEPERLGYRGFELAVAKPGGQLTFHVYDGSITSGGQAYRDPGRALERWLLGTGGTTIAPDLSTYVDSEISHRP